MTRPWRSRAYRAWIREQPCAACGAPPPSDPHHHTLKPGSKAMGVKVTDAWCVPLCRRCHDKLDSPGWSEKRFWATVGKEPRKIIRALRQRYLRERRAERWAFAPIVRCPRCSVEHRAKGVGKDQHCDECQEDRWKARPCLRCGRMMMTVPERRMCESCYASNEQIGETYRLAREGE